VFMNDNDNGSGNNSLYSNVRVYEGSCNGSLSSQEIIAQLSHKESLIGTENEGIETIKMIPNPTSDQFTIDVNSNSTKEIKINIYTILGQEKLNTSLTPGVNHFSANDLSLGSGVYVVKIQSEGDQNIIKKLIIK